MKLSIFDLFKVGIGPSSSHTVGPMLAASRFVEALEAIDTHHQLHRITVELYGALALTGIGHHTDTAILLGLSGFTPSMLDSNQVAGLIDTVRSTGWLNVNGTQVILFHQDRDMQFLGEQFLPLHPNGMMLKAFDVGDKLLFQETYYSIGGGFVLNEQEAKQSASQNQQNQQEDTVLPYPFNNAAELLQSGDEHQLSIAEMVLNNEKVLTEQNDQQIKQQILAIWQVMEQSIEHGCQQEGILPGGLKVKRRASALYKNLSKQKVDVDDPLKRLDWLNVFAMAVNEENAAGGRVVTAPTNGAAGVIPAVLAYYQRFVPNSGDEGICTFLATAAAIGMLYKTNASISAAEVGCQGEIGVACSMAAAGFCAVLGGNNQQIANAAEIGMEHNLGLTCDPIAGLVQIPCIERNAMGAVKAVNAARLALQGDGEQHVSLDSVIETMRQTGADMQSKYKETALGGLAVNVVMC